VDCSILDWFHDWPQEGLISVAGKALKGIDFKQKDSILKTISFLHTSSKEWRDQY